MADFTGKRLISESILSDVADAIRGKAEIDDKIMPTEYAELIRSLIGSGINDYYDSWRGVISPMDGTFQQSYYNNGIAVDDKIYFIRGYGHSHYGGDNLHAKDHMRWYCYDTTNNTTTFTTPMADGEMVLATSVWKGSDGAIYGFGWTDGVPYRYKTVDLGVTWTREQLASDTPKYDSCPSYKLSSGRIIGTMLARTKMLMISDDEGLTWRTITPFTDEQFAEAGITGYISMSHGTICELDDCLALYFNSPMQVSDNSSKRYVSLSYDNGDTWTLPVACSGDMTNAGYYISPGGIVKFGRKYHYVCSNRYFNLKYAEDENYYLIGECLWFTGSANDVKNGTMKLKKKLSQTLFTSQGFNPTMAARDVGNGGVTLCNGALYANYGNNIYNKDDENRIYTSNSGIEMFRIGMDDEEDAPPYWDAEFKAKYDAIHAAAYTSYNYYFYSPDKTNINSVDWFGSSDEYGYFPNEGSFKLPLGSGDFEINGIYQSEYLSLSRSYPNIYAGIEESDGTLHALGCISRYEPIFDKANDNVPSGVLGGGSPTTYFTFKRQNGVYTYTINGVTVTDPPFGWTFGKDSLLLGVDETSYVYNINSSDETVQAWIDEKLARGDIRGLRMLTVSCDADYHGTTRDHSVTYNLTGCSSSNATTGVNDGRAYSTTITVNPGYELTGEITCTMGGVAQTVTDGVITIEAVTGDIVITATATNALPADVLYRITEPVTFNGKSDYIDTGVKLFDTQKDFTLLIDWQSSGAGGIIGRGCIMHSLYEDSPYHGIQLREQATTYTMTFNQTKDISAYSVNDGFEVSETSSIRCAFRVDWSSGVGTISRRYNESGEVFTSGGDVTFMALENTVLLGCYRNTSDGKDRFAKGTLRNCTIYNRALSDDEINAYLTT